MDNESLLIDEINDTTNVIIELVTQLKEYSNLQSSDILKLNIHILKLNTAIEDLSYSLNFRKKCMPNYDWFFNRPEHIGFLTNGNTMIF